MSYAHLTESTNTNKLNVFCNNLNSSGTSTQGAITCTSLTATGTVTGLGMTVGASGLSSAGNISLAPAAGNAVIGINAVAGQAAAVNYTVDGVLAGSVAADANGLTINGALSDPTFDVNVTVAGANKILANSSWSYSAAVFSGAPAAGASPLVANTRVAYLRYTGVACAAGAETSVVWTNSLVSAASIINVMVISQGSATNSALQFKSTTPGSGSAEIFFVNGTATNVTSTTLTLVCEILN